MTTICATCGIASGLGTQIDVDLTLAVAAALTPQQRQEWRDGDTSLITGIGTGRDVDAEWLADLIDQHYPTEEI